MSFSRAFRSAGVVVLALVVAQLAIHRSGLVPRDDGCLRFGPTRDDVLGSLSGHNLEELKDLFDRYEADLRKVLELGRLGRER